MIRAAIYARVSSSAQREAHTIENQLRSLPAFVASQGWTIAGTYVDDGRSAKTGRLDRREGFARLVRDAESKRFDVLVVADVDRLTRTDDMRERAEILGPFQRAGIRIVTPSGGELDLRTMLGELYVTLHAIVAAEENRKRTDRIKAGKLRAIAEGRKPAGPTPFGLAYDRKAGAWSIDEAAAAVVRQIFERVAGGESCVAIADDLAARSVEPSPRCGWTRAAVYRLVRSRTPVGEWCADKRRASTIRVPAIITEELWREASSALLAHRRRGLKRSRHVYLLEGLAVCAACGSPIAIRSAGSYLLTSGEKRWNPAAYVCRARKLRGACDAAIVKCGELDDRVWREVSRELEAPELVAALAEVGRDRDADGSGWKADAEGYRARISRLDRIEATVLDRHRRGLISEVAFDHELEAIARDRRVLADQLATAERAVSSAASARVRLEAASALLEGLRAALPSATPEQRRALLRELVEPGGVILDRGRARVRVLLPLEAAESDADTSRISSVVAPGYSKHHGAIGGRVFTIRLVA